MDKRNSTNSVRTGMIRKSNPPRQPIIDALSTWRSMAHEQTNTSAKAPTNLVKFVDVNAIVRPSSTDKRTYFKAPSKVNCTECIIQEPKILGLETKLDQIRQQFIELEKENKLLKLQLNVKTPTPTQTVVVSPVVQVPSTTSTQSLQPQSIVSEPSDDIPMESVEDCKICSATLTQHELRTHTCIDLKEVICEYCPQAFDSTNDLWNHLINSTVHNNKIWHRCNECSKTFPAAMLLKCHKDVEHPQWNLKLFQCGVCNESFEQPRELKKHLSSHTAEEKQEPIRYECYICKIRMDKPALVRRHIKQHAYNKCGICSKHLASSETKQFHMCDMCDTVEHSIKCEYCDSQFPAISALLAHLLECEHVNKTMYRCSKCPKHFAMKHLVDIHEKHHSHPEDEKPFVCDQCSRRFRHKHVLKMHIYNMHSAAAKNFVCSKCGKSFKKEGELKLHDVVHSNASIQCADCPAIFKSQFHLNLHRQTHENVRYKCTQCSATFSRKGSLSYHTRQVHVRGNAKNLQCTLCSFKCSNSAVLRNHMITHTGEKRYECNHCGQKYSQGNSLKDHLKIHVGENVYLCAQCGQGFRRHLEYRNHTFEHYKQDQQKSAEGEEANTSKAQ